MVRAPSFRVKKRPAAPQSAHSAHRMSGRQRTRLAAEASGSGTASTRPNESGTYNTLEQMVSEATVPPAQHDSPPSPHQPSEDLYEVSDLELEEENANMGQRYANLRQRQAQRQVQRAADDEKPSDTPLRKATVCPITDKDERPFPLMQLPAEIRNEIYRACLTRPFNILLSKKEPPPRKWTSKGKARADESTETAGTEGDVSFAETVLAGMSSTEGEESDTNSDDEEINTDPFVRAEPTNTRSHSMTTRNSGRRSTRATLGRSATDTDGDGVRLVRSRRTPISSAQRAVISARRTFVTSSSSFKEENRPQYEDPLIINLLGVSKTVYSEARSILYSENRFTLDLDTAMRTIEALHQRSRRQIKHVEVEIPCYNEILERFQETVRLSLRYCWGLKTLVIHMPFTLPGADGSGTFGNTTVYANGFDILRWLPRPCEVQLKGNVCAEIKAVVSKNATLAKTLDELAYARRQLISNENDRTA